MEFKEALARRRMVRNYQDRPLDDAVLDRILDGPAAERDSTL